MKTIQLSKQEVVLVDDEDFDRLNHYKWYLSVSSPDGSGYACRSCYANGKVTSIYMHRELLNVPKGFQTDHKDGNKLNNQKDNLRIATGQENCRNRPRRGNNKSGYKGVTQYEDGRRWEASIWLDGHKHKYIGVFESAMDAALAYDKSAIEFFGEFARLNFPVRTTN